jgi:hypothetical protein
LGVKLQKDGASFVSSREEEQSERKRDVLVGFWKHGSLVWTFPRLDSRRVELNRGKDFKSDETLNPKNQGFFSSTRTAAHVAMARFGQGSTGSSDSLHVPVNPELFTDTAELPLLGWHEKADTLVACIYCLLLAAYGMLLVSSWLPLPLLLSQVALFSVCNLLLLVVTGQATIL